MILEYIKIRSTGVVHDNEGNKSISKRNRMLLFYTGVRVHPQSIKPESVA